MIVAPVPSGISVLIERAQRCLTNGFWPVPVLGPSAPALVERDGRTVRRTPGKQPHPALWARKDREVYGATVRSVAGWARLSDIADHPNLGLACGSAVAVDVDVYEPWLADAIEALAVEALGRTPLRRIGQPPKRLLVYQGVGGPLRKAQTPELWKGDLKAEIEVLGHGLQFVAFGVHPVTRAPFAWDGPTPETTPLAELPAVTQAQVAAFVAEAERRLRAAGYRTKAEIDAGRPGPGPERPGADDHAARGADPFKAVNEEALRRPEAWVRRLFPNARRSANGAWRVSSADLGRDLEEDLSVSPQGIKDFGVHDQGDPREGRRTPVDLVIEHGGAPDAKAAARWLADRLGIEITFAGKRGTEAGEEAGGLSHDALALEMGARWGGTAKHVAPWGRWLFWDGTKWEADERLLYLTKTRAFLRRKAATVRGTEARLRSADMVANVAGLARSNPEIGATVAMWDADPWKLNTPVGIVDLRTGELRPPDRRAYCTKSTAVAPAAPGTPAPIWDAFLGRVFRHDPRLIPYLERVLGYGLTGLTVEHVLVFAWGQGANGKGTLFNTASRLLGTYAAVAPPDLLLVTQSDRHPCDLAMLRGARLVTAQELAPGRAWDEPKLKSLTGGDPITARFMRQDFFTYEPQFLLVAAGNHKPSFKGVDEAIRRRVQLVPFLQNIPAEERDKDLPEKLKAEWPAILRRLIDGCLAWQREGLNPPESVRKASDEYLSAEDTLGQWLEERCVVRPAIAFTAAAALYGDWRGWCERGGSSPGSQRTFGKALDERGFARARRNTAKGFAGIGLREPPREPESPGDRSDRSSVIDRQRIPAPSTSYTPTSDKGGPVTSVTRHGKPAADGVPDPRQLDLEAAIGEVRTSVPAGFPVQWRLIADAGEASRALAALPVADDETPSGQEP